MLGGGVVQIVVQFEDRLQRASQSKGLSVSDVAAKFDVVQHVATP